MNKRLTKSLVFILVLAAALIALGTGVLAGENDVAQIGETGYATLQEAITAAESMTGDVTVTLLSDITETVTIKQKAGLNLTLDGGGNTVTGQLYIDGDGRYNDADTLTIQNIKFAYSTGFSGDTFINIASKSPAHNYAHNVTVKDCEFAGEGTTTVAFRVASGAGANKVTLDKLKVTNGHSFAQLVGVKDLTITDCTVTGTKNGINIDGGDGTGTISGTTITDSGYTVRLQRSSGMAVTLSDNTFSGGEGLISIATGGGTITVESGDYTGALTTDPATDASKLIIKGSTFSEDPSAYVADGYLVNGPTNGKYTVFDENDAVAQIGTAKYATLADAVAAAQDGDTITLLKDCSGNGIVVPQGKFNTNGLTIDFAGSTYTVDGNLVGSTGTENQASQLLKDNKITFKNGTVYSEKALFLVQNYSDLTLDGMTLTLKNANYSYGYTLSNNNGNVTIKDSTINANPAGAFAFDVCRYSSYPEVHVTVTGSSVINGDIEVSASGSDAKDGFGLALNGGTLNGDIVLDSSAKTAMASTPEKVSITKDADFVAKAPYGYEWKNDTTLAPADPVAQIGDDLYYTLAEAVDAVPADGTETTITILKDQTVEVAGYAITVPASKNIVLDLNGHEVVGACTESGTSALIRNQGTLTVNDSVGGGKLIGGADPTWTWDGSDDYSGSYASNLIRNEGTLTVNGGTLYNASTGSAAYAIDNYSAGQVTINGGTVDAKKASAIRLFYNNGGKVEVTGGTVGHNNSADDRCYMGIQVMAGTDADVIVSGGTVAGQYPLYSNGSGDSSVLISGGTFDGNYLGFSSTPDDISITGGTFLGWAGTWGEQTKFISGGEFASEPDASYIVPGKVAVQDGNMWKIGTLDDAFVVTFVPTVPTGAANELTELVDAEVGGTVTVDVKMKNNSSSAIDVVSFMYVLEMDSNLTAASIAQADVTSNGTLTLDTSSQSGKKIINYDAQSNSGLISFAGGAEITVGTLTLNVAASPVNTKAYGETMAIGMEDNPAKNSILDANGIDEFTPTSESGQVELVTKYTITYDANGGNIDPATQEVGYKVAPTPATPTKDGFTFAGWQDANGNLYAPETALPVATAAATYTAIWTFAGNVVFVDYAYAASGDKLMLVGYDAEPTQAALYDGKALFWTDDSKYTELLTVGDKTYGKAYLYIVPGAVTAADVYPKLTFSGATSANIKIDRDCDVNLNDKINAGDWGLVDNLLAQRQSAATVNMRLEADTYLDDNTTGSAGTNRFGSIEDIATVIKTANDF